MVFSACRRHDATGRPRQSVRRPHRQTLLQFRRHHPGVGRRMGRNPERLASRARGDQCVGATPAAERYRGSMRRSAPRTHKPTKLSASHLNQKPLDLMERCINATTNPGDIVWEPFGGLCSASVAAVRLGRTAFSAEPNADFYQLAYERLSSLNKYLF